MLVRCGPVVDPIAIGQPASTLGFPACLARVRYLGHGYSAFFGWVQMVRSTDNPSGGERFEMDPLSIHQDCPSPYAFYGLLPDLFDAPSREARDEMQWTAHSFLAATPLDENLRASPHHRRVIPLVGFSWGFDIDRNQRIQLRAAERLDNLAWSRHLALLEETFPAWRFASGIGKV